MCTIYIPWVVYMYILYVCADVERRQTYTHTRTHTIQSLSLKLLILEVMEQMSTSTLTLHSSYEEAIALSKKYNGWSDFIWCCC